MAFRLRFSRLAAQPTASNLLRSINAITLATVDMAASFDFYSALGLKCSYGGRSAPFTTMDSGDPSTNIYHVNLFVKEDYKPQLQPVRWNGWGRVIFYAKDVDHTCSSFDVVFRSILPNKNDSENQNQATAKATTKMKTVRNTRLTSCTTLLFRKD